ncbi:hypothetical protein GCM10009790_40000 [Georgenia ruanii]|uniref:EthD domain-containing protein n=1 Tax=Georgenia ruanii TaxID=348442 RepID=UPI0031E195A6
MLRKRIALLQRRPDLSFQDFDAHWAIPHATLIAALPGLGEYVQNPVRSFWTNGDPGATLDGIVEVWFDDAAVASPEAHTSTAQQDDEVRFIRTLTAFTVTRRESYDPPAKVWVLSPEPLDLAHLGPAAAHRAAIVTAPEADTRLMERPRLLREAAPPAAIAVLPVTVEESGEVFDAVVAALSRESAPPCVRVLRTTTRRVR